MGPSLGAVYGGSGRGATAEKRVWSAQVIWDEPSAQRSTLRKIMVLSSTRIEELAREAGFAAAGIAAVPEPGSAEDEEERARFAGWVEEGRAGTMEYLKRRDEAGRLVRSSVRVALPWARSVIVCAANYHSAEPRSTDPAPEGAGWIARYAWTGNGDRPTDYHKVLLRRLEEMRDRLNEEAGPFESRCFVDTGPVVERVYARYAGVGWTGKNTCLLNQRLGSWLFLGVIVTSLEVEAEQKVQLAADRCGSCTRCIDACPTGALTAPREMDASRCIAYLTIENRGAMPEELRAGVGRQVFGCDICQDVCPWNRRAPVAADPELRPRRELVNPALEWLAEMDAPEFGRRFNGSPVRRAKFLGFRRNLAIAMGNSGQPRYLLQLQEWSRDTDPVLAEAAEWALRNLRRGKSSGERL
jgi:epoxyqueuosine reductase